MAYNFQTGKTYSFRLYPTSIFTTDFSTVVVEGTVGSVVAQKYGDIYSLHAQVYPSLPSGTPNDPRSYNYLILRTTSGASVIVGVPWIIEDTIEVIESVNIEVTVSGVSASDAADIRNCLVQNGYNQLKIRVLT